LVVVLFVQIYVAEVDVAVSDGDEEVVIVGDYSDWLLALQESGSQNLLVSIPSVQKGGQALLAGWLWNILEVVSNQVVGSAAFWVNWIAGQFADWNSVVDSWYTRS